MEYINGDATSPIGSGMKILIHVCNVNYGWGRGFVVSLSKKWKEPEIVYRKSNLVLGEVQFIQVRPDIIVTNMIAQKGFKSRSNPIPLQYDALNKCLKKVGEKAKELGASVHGPKFGSNLSGGDWNKIEELIEENLKGINVKIYVLN